MGLLDCGFSLLGSSYKDPEKRHNGLRVSGRFVYVLLC